MEATYCRECGQLIPVADLIAGPAACPHCHAAINHFPAGDSGSTSPAGWDEGPINPFALPGEPQFGSAPIDAGPPPSNSLAWIALALPVLTAVAECFISSGPLNMALGFATVVVTSILIYLDARQLGPLNRKGLVGTSPWGLLIGGILLWIVVYPLAFFRRRHFGGPNLGPLSLLVAVIFLGLPVGVALVVPKKLPACDSAEVKQVLVQIVSNAPAFKQGSRHLSQIDGHRELGFDAEKQIRTATCTAHTDFGAIPLTYTVSWQDRDKGMFFVKISNE